MKKSGIFVFFNKKCGQCASSTGRFKCIASPKSATVKAYDHPPHIMETLLPQSVAN